MNRKDISYVFKNWLLADKERFEFSACIYKNTTLEILNTLGFWMGFIYEGNKSY